MAKRKKRAGPKRRRYHRRTPEEQIVDLEAQITELRAVIADRKEFSPDALREDRERLGLSAADYARLVGVSPLTIYSWEGGRTHPRAAQLDQWLSVRGMPKKKAYSKLGIEVVDAKGSFSPEAVLAERDRLELSARDYGEIVGVSMLTIYNWEKGKSRPRNAQLAKWLAVKGLGKREAWKRLGLI
jgi:DNA-binding transcriptional regulator YiaG